MTTGEPLDHPYPVCLTSNKNPCSNIDEHWPEMYGAMGPGGREGESEVAMCLDTMLDRGVADRQLLENGHK